MKCFRYIPQLLLGMLALTCLIAAICVAENVSAVEFVNRPFEWLCRAIRDTHEGGNAVGAWCLYIFIGILPLIVPVAGCAVRRRFCPHSLIWVVLSVCTFAAIYLGINKEIFAPLYIFATEDYYSIIIYAICFIWLGVAMLCIVTECGYSLRKTRTSAYMLGQILIYFYAAICIVYTFYICVSDAAYEISLFNETALSAEDYPLNALAIAMPAALKCLSVATTICYLSIVAHLLHELKRDSLSVRAVRLLKTSSIAGKISIISTICLALVSNIVVLSTVRNLISIRFSVTIPLFELLSVCLAMIAIEILKRAITADEENKLTI